MQPESLSIPPRATAPRAPGIAQSLALMAIFYGLVIATTLLLNLFRSFGQSAPSAFLSLLIEQAVAWLITIWFGLRWSGTRFREVCPIRPFPLGLTAVLIVSSFGATILLLEASSWIPMPETLRKYMTEAKASSSAISLFFSVVIAAPLAEEIFFRGLVLPAYLSRYSRTKAIWASALFFAIFHLDPWQAICALPFGLVCAWLTLRTDSLVPAMLSHATANCSTNFLLTPLILALGYDAEKIAAAEHFPPLILGIGAMAAVIGGLILWRQLEGKRVESDS